MKKIIGNWKCNQTLIDVIDFAKSIDNLSYDKSKLMIGVAIPDVWLFVAKTYLKNIDIFAQDVDYVDFGSFTGRTSYKHLQDIGINHVILGHSETRAFDNNSNLEINKKILKCVQNDIQVVLCIGEPIEVYQTKKVEEYLIRQIVDAIVDVPLYQLGKISIAYEPIWAIGTNKTPSNEEIENIINTIKQYLNINYNLSLDVLYGGSVNLKNIEHLVNIPNLDGFLIGTASLDANVFLDLIGKTRWNVN